MYLSFMKFAVRVDKQLKEINKFFGNRLSRSIYGMLRQAGVASCFLMTCLIGKRQDPRAKFFILTRARSGSTLIVDLLNSHPDIICDEEALYLHTQSPELYITRKMQMTAGKAYGFKVMLQQLTERQKIKNPGGFMKKLCDKGWKIIYLKREDLLRHALSFEVVDHRQSHHHKKSEGPLDLGRIKVNWKRVLRNMEKCRQNERLEEDALKWVPCLRICYEENLSNPKKQQDTLNKIFQYIGLPNCSVTTELQKITPSKLESFVENLDEGRCFLAGTEYEKFLSGSTSKPV